MPVPGFVVCEYAPHANGIGQPYQVAEESSYGTALNTASSFHLDKSCADTL